MLGELALAAALTGAILIPHLLPLERARPMSSAAVWLAVLSLRALVAVGGAIFVFLYLPQAGIVQSIGSWCWHELLPVATDALGFSDHPVGHAAVALPALAIGASLLWLLVGLARGWLALRRKLGRALGAGPLGSLVVPDQRVLVAVTRVGRRRIVVSDRALGELDEAELRASLTHELGHLDRRHRPLLLAGAFLGALGRALPGTRAAEAWLALCLERDADEYAVARTRDPLALASAICKAAGTNSSPLLASVRGPGPVSLRLQFLLDRSDAGGPHHDRSVRGLAAALASLAIALAAALPAWALAAPASAGPIAQDHICRHAG